MTIILWSPWNFASMESIWLECNPTVDLSKFTYNNKLLSGTISLKFTPGKHLDSVGVLASAFSAFFFYWEALHHVLSVGPVYYA